MSPSVFHFSFRDPGPVGNGRYSEHMLPEVEIKDFRTGAQVNLFLNLVAAYSIICFYH